MHRHEPPQPTQHAKGPIRGAFQSPTPRKGWERNQTRMDALHDCYRRRFTRISNVDALRASKSRFSLGFVEYVRPARRYSAVSGIRSNVGWSGRSRQDRREVHAAWLALLAVQGATWRPARSSTEEGPTGRGAGR